METQEEKKYFVREATGLTRQVGGFYAMIGNIMVMGLGYGLVFAFFTQLLYPGVDLPYTVLFAVTVALIVSSIYYLFSVAMPRTGGDYIWASRILHPTTGFVANVLITFTLITTNGVVAAWIVVYGLAPMFDGLGIISSNQSLINLATTVSTLPDSFIISLIVLCIFIMPLFSSTKNIFRYLTVIFAIALVSTLILIAAFFSAPNATFVSNFNHLSGMNYANVISTAGLPSGFILTATLTGGVFTIINFLGFNNSAYYGGEVKNAKSSQLFGMFAAVLLGAAVLGLVYASAYYSVGANFLNAISNLAGTGNAAYTLPAAPTLNFLAVFASPNPFVVVASSLALIATSVGSITAFTFVHLSLEISLIFAA
jgi:amino acid transporter